MFANYRLTEGIVIRFAGIGKYWEKWKFDHDEALEEDSVDL